MGKAQKNEFEISGEVLFVGMPKEIPRTNNLMKRILVIQGWIKGKYKCELAFDFVNENMDKLNNIRVGDWVSVDFHVRGNKKIQDDGLARWFTNLEGDNCIVDRD